MVEYCSFVFCHFPRTEAVAEAVSKDQEVIDAPAFQLRGGLASKVWWLGNAIHDGLDSAASDLEDHMGVGLVRGHLDYDGVEAFGRGEVDLNKLAGTQRISQWA